MKKLMLGVLASLAVTASFAQANDQKLPVPIQMAITGGMKVEKSFPAAGGMTGWILSQGVGQNMVVFTPANGEVLIAGNMIDRNGKNLTKQYLDEHAPKVDYGKMWSELEKATWVAEGPKSAKSVIYVFKDANCSFCHLAWKALQAYEKAGLQVRWVPVAFLAPDSMNKAAAMITAKDPNAFINELHSKWGSKQTYPEASAEVRAKVEANNKLMNAWGFRGTPATIYKNKSGQVEAMPGMFRLGDLPEITGLPEQAINDPALARFK